MSMTARSTMSFSARVVFATCAALSALVLGATSVEGSRSKVADHFKIDDEQQELDDAFYRAISAVNPSVAEARRDKTFLAPAKFFGNLEDTENNCSEKVKVEAVTVRLEEPGLGNFWGKSKFVKDDNVMTEDDEQLALEQALEAANKAAMTQRRPELSKFRKAEDREAEDMDSESESEGLAVNPVKIFTGNMKSVKSVAVSVNSDIDIDLDLLAEAGDAESQAETVVGEESE